MLRNYMQFYKIKGISYILSSRQKCIDMLLLEGAKECFPHYNTEFPFTCFQVSRFPHNKEFYSVINLEILQEQLN